MTRVVYTPKEPVCAEFEPAVFGGPRCGKCSNTKAAHVKAAGKDAKTAQ
jgi:hypothetical protein